MEPVVSVGETGEWVHYLQELLLQSNFDPGPADGGFGDRTEAAVLAFQDSHGLLVDGVVGPTTWRSLSDNTSTSPDSVSATDTLDTVMYPDDTTATPPADQVDVTDCPTLSMHDRGEWVGYLQERLREAGVDPGPIDSVFGGGTDTAVRHFQAGCGLVADGVVGPATWAAVTAGTTTGGSGDGTDTGTSPLDEYFDDYNGGTGGGPGFGDKGTSGPFGGDCDSTRPLPIHSPFTVGVKATVEVGFRTPAVNVTVNATSRRTKPMPPVVDDIEHYRVTLVQCGLVNDELATDVQPIGTSISFSHALPKSIIQTDQFFFEIKNGSSNTPIEVDLDAT